MRVLRALFLGLAAAALAGEAPQPTREALAAYRKAVAAARAKLTETYHAAVAEAAKKGDAATAERLRGELRAMLRATDPNRPLPDQPRVTLTPERLDAYVGRYAVRGNRVQSVTREGDRLFVTDPWTQRKIELIPLGGDVFRRADWQGVCTFHRDETGKVVECSSRRAAEDARRLDAAGLLTWQVRVRMDGQSRLILKGDTMRWHHLDWVVPGRQDNANLPTMVNGKPWFPVWPDGDGWRNNFGLCTSSLRRGLKPALPRRPADVYLGVLEGRGAVRLIDAPCPDNDFALTVELDDWQNGEDEYAVEIHVRPRKEKPEPVAEVPIPTDGLELHLPLDGDAKDASGKGRHGTVDGAVPTADRFGRAGKACAFDGDDAVRVPAPPRQAISPFSLSVWFSYDRVGAGWHDTVIAQDRPGARAWHLVGLYDRVTWHRFVRAPEVGRTVRVKADTWYHVVVTFDGTHHTFYQDGVLCDRKEGTLAALNDAPILIGRKEWEGQDAYFLNGKVDDVRIYHRALTRREAKALYHEGGFGRHPLVEATAGGHLDRAKKLVGEKADVNAANRAGLTPLYAAADAGHVAVVDFLLARGATPNTKSLGGETAVHAAARAGHLEVLERLLAAGADADAASERGRRPLHEAAACGHHDHARLLLAAGADPNAPDRRRDTPLHRAAAYGHTQMADLLLKLGANLAARNRNGHTPRQIAMVYRHGPMAAHLADAARKGRGATEF